MIRAEFARVWPPHGAARRGMHQSRAGSYGACRPLLRRGCEQVWRRGAPGNYGTVGTGWLRGDRHPRSGGFNQRAPPLPHPYAKRAGGDATTARMAPITAALMVRPQPVRLAGQGIEKGLTAR
jgi:hypothetical protein